MARQPNTELITYDETGAAILSQEVVDHIVELERDLKAIQEQEKALRQALMKAFEANNILSMKAEGLTVSYIPETTRETFDSKAFRADFAELYDDYVKISPVAATLKISAK